MTDEQFNLLYDACRWHTDQKHHADATSGPPGACWDADRLDLGRAGAVPDAGFMSTAMGRRIAGLGSVERWLATGAAEAG